MKLSKGIQFFAGSTQTTYDLTNLNLSAGNYAITVVAEAEGFTDSDASNSVNYTVQAQLAAPTIAMNADGKTLEITDVANATSYDVYVDGTLKTNVQKVTGYKLTFLGTYQGTDTAGGMTSQLYINGVEDDQHRYESYGNSRTEVAKVRHLGVGVDCPLVIENVSSISLIFESEITLNGKVIIVDTGENLQPISLTGDSTIKLAWREN